LPDGKTLTVGTANGTVQLFEVATGKAALPAGSDRRSIWWIADLESGLRSELP
jgi:hypothetical protein